MPLPRQSERAATQVQAILTRVDDRVVEYISGGRPLPTENEIMGELGPLVFVAVRAAMREADPGVTDRDVNRAAQTALRGLQAAIRGQLAEARRARRRLPRTPPTQDEGETVAGFVRRVGKWAALGALLAVRRRVEPAQVARQVGVRLPARTAGYGRMIVRTESAIQRNLHTARVVTRRGSGVREGDWAVWVRDALRGPTDAACEAVNEKWATPVWIRNHPVEHPNCTRQGRPRKLPPGATVTLLE